MYNIKTILSGDHARCDAFFLAAEQAASRQEWDIAEVTYSRFHDAMRQHFATEETLLFPAFEMNTGMVTGPTQAMRAEHLQMRQLMLAAQNALTARDVDEYAGNAETLLIMMHQHNMKEENVLYPMCDRHLKDRKRSTNRTPIAEE
jgi:hemerythrin-like domain-containing protein